MRYYLKLGTNVKTPFGYCESDEKQTGKIMCSFKKTKEGLMINGFEAKVLTYSAAIRSFGTGYNNRMKSEHALSLLDKYEI